MNMSIDDLAASEAFGGGKGRREHDQLAAGARRRASACTR